MYPVRKASNEAIQQALFDYLNLNPHKFDEHGNFGATYDERDFVPRLLLVSDPYNPPKLTPEKPWLNKTQRHWAKYPVANQLRNPKTDEDLIRERYEQRMEHSKNRRKYTKDQCEKHHEDALNRCNKMYWNNALYPDGSFEGCKRRATELWEECLKKKRYPKGKMEWGLKDMDMDHPPETVESTQKYEGVDIPIGQEAPGSALSDIPTRDWYAWAKSHLPAFSPPLVEGSNPSRSPGFTDLLPLLPPMARAVGGLRLTPGLGSVGRGGNVGGGKRPLIPRNPADFLSFQMLLN